MGNIKRGYDSGFVSASDYEEGFRESDATRWGRQQGQKGSIFDYSRNMGPQSEVKGLSHEGAQESLEESSPERHGMPLEDRMKEAGVTKADLFGDEWERGQDKAFLDYNASLADFDTGKRNPGTPKFKGEVASRMALEDMSPEQLAEMGLEPGTFAPVERDDGDLSL